MRKLFDAAPAAALLAFLCVITTPTLADSSLIWEFCATRERVIFGTPEAEDILVETPRADDMIVGIDCPLLPNLLSVIIPDLGRDPKTRDSEAVIYFYNAAVGQDILKIEGDVFNEEGFFYFAGNVPPPAFLSYFSKGTEVQVGGAVTRTLPVRGAAEAVEKLLAVCPLAPFGGPPNQGKRPLP